MRGEPVGVGEVRFDDDPRLTPEMRKRSLEEGDVIVRPEVQPDGSLANGQPFYRLETPDESSASGADGMTVDSDGYLYIATKMGVQVCDQPGRVVAIINKPQAGPLSNVVFGGPDLRTLYVTAGDKVFRRAIRRKGVFPWAPLKPPVPGL